MNHDHSPRKEEKLVGEQGWRRKTLWNIASKNCECSKFTTCQTDRTSACVHGQTSQGHQLFILKSDADAQLVPSSFFINALTLCFAQEVSPVIALIIFFLQVVA
mmetsp:Transcript_14378/g.21219  ORF Transcript_14378/g.21219 Transcript_14378/m.21219 type:complete len:104 (-) Transcript_14378:1961-2272(-)